jgi:hypothetical protein
MRGVSCGSDWGRTENGKSRSFVLGLGPIKAANAI